MVCLMAILPHSQDSLYSRLHRLHTTSLLQVNAAEMEDLTKTLLQLSLNEENRLSTLFPFNVEINAF